MINELFNELMLRGGSRLRVDKSKSITTCRHSSKVTNQSVKGSKTRLLWGPQALPMTSGPTPLVDYSRKLLETTTGGSTSWPTKQGARSDHPWMLCTCKEPMPQSRTHRPRRRTSLPGEQAYVCTSEHVVENYLWYLPCLGLSSGPPGVRPAMDIPVC